MPYVKIQVTPPNVTKEQKQRLIKGVTDLLVETLNKDPRTTFVVIEEIDPENWGVEGKQVSELRKN